ncbi:MAG: hypothetical protein H6599_02445 [Flavobacteriales bacterium]|nr:hypothetical protein [Flavobacteriales bacterium]
MLLIILSFSSCKNEGIEKKLYGDWELNKVEHFEAGWTIYPPISTRPNGVGFIQYYESKGSIWRFKETNDFEFKVVELNDLVDYVNPDITYTWALDQSDSTIVIKASLPNQKNVLISDELKVLSLNEEKLIIIADSVEMTFLKK